MTFLKKNWAPLILVLLVLFYFREFFWTGSLIYGQDIIGLNYPIMQFIVDSYKSGQLPLWNPYSASGYPFLPASQALYPLNAIFLVLPLDPAFSLSHIIHFLIAGLGMYAWTRYFNVSKDGSLLSAVSFTFSGFFVARLFAGHFMLIQSFAWFPWFFMFLEKALENFKKKDLVIAAILASLVLLPGHPQPFIYLVVFSLLYTLGHTWLIPSKKLKKVCVWIGVLIVSVLLSAIYLFPTVEGVLNSQRGEKISWGAASEGSLSPKQLINFVLPDFYGNPATGNYHGGALYNEVAVYIGLIPLLLVLTLVFKIKSYLRNFGGLGKEKRLLILGSLVFISLFLALGKYNPVYRLIYEIVPGFSNARIPARLTWITELILPLLAGVGLDYLLSRRQEIKLFLDSKWGGFSKFSKKISQKNFLIVLMILVVGDLFFYANKSLIYTSGDYFFKSDELTKYVQSDPEKYFRNYYLGESTFHDRGNVYQIFEIQSDASLIAGVYGKLLEKFKVRDPILDQAKERAIVRNNNARLLEVLNVKYVIPEGGFPDTEKLKRVADLEMAWFRDFGNRFPTKKIQETPVFKQTNYLPRFYISHQGTIASEEEVLDVVTNEPRNVDLKSKSFFETQDEGLDRDLNSVSGKDYSDEEIVEVKSYRNNEIILSVNTASNGFLNSSEIYYPGWKAFVDGQEAKVRKTNYAFRSVYLPQGSKEVRFLYDPLSFKLGSWVTLATLVTLSLFVFRASLRRFPRLNPLAQH